MGYSRIQALCCNFEWIETYRYRDMWMQIRKALVAVVLVLTFAGSVEASSQSRRIVVDSNSGLALYGYDPVAYFTDNKAIRGKPKYEVVWKGVSWIFASQANREVFEADPEIYAPQYGGHGALAVARGYVSGANPTIWALYKDKLYLFYSFTSRSAWAVTLDKHIERGDREWIKLEADLTR